MDVLSQLQSWYLNQVNGSWEHDYGITIESTDNPGWWVKIQLKDTPLFSKPFTDISSGDENSNDWLRCYLQDGVFHGAGDGTKLSKILQHFIAWTRA